MDATGAAGVFFVLLRFPKGNKTLFWALYRFLSIGLRSHRCLNHFANCTSYNLIYDLNFDSEIFGLWWAWPENLLWTLKGFINNQFMLNLVPTMFCWWLSFTNFQFPKLMMLTSSCFSVPGSKVNQCFSLAIEHTLHLNHEAICVINKQNFHLAKKTDYEVRPPCNVLSRS